VYHNRPRLPRNLHFVTTSGSPDIAIRTKHATGHVQSAAPTTQNDDGGLQSAAPARKTYCDSSSENDTRVLRLPHQMNFDAFPDTLECQEVPRLPRNITTCCDTFEKERFCSFPYA